jgi:hypothetical protein
MIHPISLRRLLNQLYQRKAEVANLICFFEKYEKRAERRRARTKRYLRLAS